MLPINAVQIEYFLALAKLKSFSKTAEYFYISQPAVSKQIRALEATLGAELFERKYRKVELTPAGKLAEEFFARQKQEVEWLRIKIQSMGTGKTGVITLGLLDGQPIEPVTKLLRSYQLVCPDVDFIVDRRTVYELSNALLEGEFDVIFTLTTALSSLSEVQSIQLYSLNYRLFYSKDHPAGKKSKPELKDFKNDTIFWTDSDQRGSDDELRMVNDELMKRFGVHFKKRQYKKQVYSIMAAVEAGLGVAALAIGPENESEYLRSIDLGIEMGVHAVWRSDATNPSVLSFVKHIKAQNPP
ncbi:MAG: LysR family transcriptional regulator [Oscillospiraceae bacterium]|jgi:DNA-binding transcriptional LysR family regulator